MKLSKSNTLLLLFCSFFILTSTKTQAQTKKIKRPKSTVGISSVDNFVRESFDLYDKVYKYDGYAAAGTPLDDEDIDVLEDVLDELTIISESAPDILADLEGVSILKQGKATLQINKAKKALKYSIKTAKELLLGQREHDKDKEDESDSSESTDSSSSGNDDNNQANEVEDSNVSDDLEVYSKFDFVPGDKLLYFDDFSQDFIGDFPSKWNTNGAGEVVKMNTVDGKWFEMKAGYNIQYIPLLAEALPEDYTIEFDILTSGLDKKTSSTARLNIVLDENDTFRAGANSATASLPFGQYGAFAIGISNKVNGAVIINSQLQSDIRNDVINKPHISIAVNKRRFRLWVNQTKYIDIPQLIAPNKAITHLKFNLYGLKDGKDRIFIRNLKIAEGGLDLRRKLITDGRISTNGILFDSGSANIKPQSYGIIRQISQVLMQDENIKLNIVGHTDSDGSDDANMKLSKSRAEAVKQALINVYKISGDRLQTDGKGESVPVGDNATSNGKAQNRRVEFIKI
ncbi:OmpA family protein [Ichthyenterobacterium magnum]|uniref:OmpA family protein n=1 Tax=Ichthyenterobacterium magnum TaxID=1230530 RepID=A0A420DG23_9FLAO|nr:OmpA family protein [Ichthyenterobacterium magnum]RKE92019.1 OmpA family protein [Ichthyenterobacterium magnum]